MLDVTVGRLREEYERTGKGSDFETLKGSLMAARGAIDYAAIAQKLGLNEGAACVAVHRLRKRFREIYRAELAQTLADGADVDGEMRHLAAALARR